MTIFRLLSGADEDLKPRRSKYNHCSVLLYIILPISQNHKLKMPPWLWMARIEVDCNL